MTQKVAERPDAAGNMSVVQVSSHTTEGDEREEHPEEEELYRLLKTLNCFWLPWRRLELGHLGEAVWTIRASALSTEFAQIKGLENLQPGLVSSYERRFLEPPAAQGSPTAASCSLSGQRMV